jgi:putative tryptophan/tyrosine transport system substrate-binding protein
MRRRDFIQGIAGVITAWPLAADAQQPGAVRRIGVLMGFSESDPQFQTLVIQFLQELKRMGWTDGRNMHIEQHWSGADTKLMTAFAKELLESRPDVILTSSTPATAALLHETKTTPIVFTIVANATAAGFVSSLAHPGGNITGFVTQEGVDAGGKWLSVLKEVAPSIKRAGFMFNPDTAPGGGKDFVASFNAAAAIYGIEPVTLPVHSDAEIEMAIASLELGPAGLVIEAEAFTTVHIGTIIASTERYRVPAIFEQKKFAKGGGLISYGPSFPEIFRNAASYVDRILHGEKPGDLPVQTPTKFETTINLKTAGALGLTVPAALLATADEVIE